MLTFWGRLNALAMTGPYFNLAQWIANTFNTQNEGLILGSFFVLMTIYSLLVSSGVAYLADLLGQGHANLKTSFLRWGYVTVALGFGFWGAHYLFHFLTGA